MSFIVLILIGWVLDFFSLKLSLSTDFEGLGRIIFHKDTGSEDL